MEGVAVANRLSCQWHALTCRGNDNLSILRPSLQDAVGTLLLALAGNAKLSSH
jgi:hypothetical protein